MQMKSNSTYNNERGLTVLLVLVFAGVFGLSVMALTSFIFSQAKLGASKEVREQALSIADAGLNYYHWFLAHNPTDLQDGTGEDGPYVHDYNDPETGEKIGTFSLEVSGNMACGQLQSVDVTSTGTVTKDTRFARTIEARHGAPSVSEYAYIIGASVWAGSGREITGPYHSNGGIRMDGTNNSIVTSAVSTWDDSFDCEASGSSPGVCGDGSGSALWQYPVSEISFDDMATNLSSMKTQAQSNGIYLAPYSTTEITYYGYVTAPNGYHLIFNADGTVDIYQVTETSWTQGYLSGIGYTLDFHTITAETFIERRTIPTDCPMIFVEDKLWVEGTVKGKVTVVAADLVNAGYDPSVILSGDINYAVGGGTDGITVISEFGIYIPPNSSDNMSLKGIFVAQGDRFGRPYYQGNIKTQLTMQGAIISRQRVGTAWISNGTTVSGYTNRDNSYDRLQVTNPPPFTPSHTPIPQYVLWQEL